MSGSTAFDYMFYEQTTLYIVHITLTVKGL